MTFYLHPHPFGSAQGRPYRRMARQLAASNERALGVNIREEDDAYILSALVPGLKADDLNIHVLEDALRIEGEYELDKSEYLLQELPHGSFKRTLRLPTVIDADHVEAKITDGVLTLKLPKAESARPKRINITS
ncbi:MAG: Hsp20/alpha crystallin family protein, partial [Anaerolineales bacterium]